LVAKPSGDAYNRVKQPARAFSVVGAKQEFNASSVALHADRLCVEFAEAGATAMPRGIRQPHHVQNS